MEKDLDNFPGPKGSNILSNLKLVVHKLAGSAGMYGFPMISETALHLEKILDSTLKSITPIDEKLKTQILSHFNSVRRELLI